MDGSLIRLFDVSALGGVLVNAASVAVLALAVALTARFVRRPSIVHVLWLVVLAKLLTPPVLEVAVLPGAAPQAALEAVEPSSEPFVAELGALVPTAVPAAVAPTPPPAPTWTLPRTLGIVWFGGSLLLLMTAIVRAARFQRSIRDARKAPDDLRRMTSAIADRIGLARIPRIRVIAARVSPMIWFPLRAPMLLLPAALVERLPRAQLEAIVAHELAHLRRRDHWVRYLELLTTTLFWWHPVVWWARRELRECEERSCDARVLELLPEGRRAYARGLVETVDFLSGPHPPTPALAVGAARVRDLETRLTMIMKHAVPRRPSRPERIALSAAVIASLLIFPTWADRTDQDTAQELSPEAAELADEQRRYKEEMREIEQRAFALQQELEELLSMRRQLEQRRRDFVIERQLEALVERADRLDADGSREEADLLRREIEILEQKSLLDRELRQVDADRAVRMRELERRLHELLVEAEELEAAGRAGDAEDLREEARAIKASMAQAKHEMALEHRDDARAKRDAERAAAEQLKLELLSEGRADEAARVEAKLAYERALALERERERRELDVEIHREQAALEKKLASLRALADRLTEEGRVEEAEETRVRIRKLLTELKKSSEVY